MVIFCLVDVMVQHHADEMTMRQARAQYFEDNGFGADGGYGETWVDFKLGPIPMPFPNTPMRVEAVRFHDLHHVLTGYATDLAGELEISAWEIGAGCKGYVVAWQLNLAGMTAGLVFRPRRTFRAFVRGRRSQSLYGRNLSALLDLTVAQAREQLGVVSTEALRPRPGDVLLALLVGIVGVAVGTVTFVMALVTLPFAYAAFFRRWRKAQQAA